MPEWNLKWILQFSRKLQLIKVNPWGRVFSGTFHATSVQALTRQTHASGVLHSVQPSCTPLSWWLPPRRSVQMHALPSKESTISPRRPAIMKHDQSFNKGSYRLTDVWRKSDIPPYLKLPAVCYWSYACAVQSLQNFCSSTMRWWFKYTHFICSLFG